MFGLYPCTNGLGIHYFITDIIITFLFVMNILQLVNMLAIGEPLTQAFSCEHNAQAGEVIIHKSINDRLDQKKFKTQLIADTNCYRIVKQIKKIRAKRLRNGTRKIGLSPHKIRILNQFILKAATLKLIHRSILASRITNDDSIIY